MAGCRYLPYGPSPGSCQRTSESPLRLNRAPGNFCIHAPLAIVDWCRYSFQDRGWAILYGYLAQLKDRLSVSFGQQTTNALSQLPPLLHRSTYPRVFLQDILITDAAGKVMLKSNPTP